MRNGFPCGLSAQVASHQRRVLVAASGRHERHVRRRRDLPHPRAAADADSHADADPDPDAAAAGHAAGEGVSRGHVREGTGLRAAQARPPPHHRHAEARQAWARDVPSARPRRPERALVRRHARRREVGQVLGVGAPSRPRIQRLPVGAEALGRPPVGAPHDRGALQGDQLVRQGPRGPRPAALLQPRPRPDDPIFAH